MLTLEERFWGYVDVRGPDECWPWTGAHNEKGYGCIGVEGKVYRAHRISVWLDRGDAALGLVVRHKCDNPPCVNPNHLTVGTQGENLKDAYDRGRRFTVPPHLVGESHPHAKLTQSEVTIIRELLKGGDLTQAQIARRFNVTQQIISLIKLGKKWKGSLK